MNRSLTDKIRNDARTALIGIFIVLIWLPILDFGFKWDKTAQVQENRTLAAFPKFGSGLAGVRKYVHGLELYYNDHFGFRRWLIYEGEQWKRGLFPQISEYNVIIGREGWLYQANPAAKTKHDQNAPFEASELWAWKTLLEKRQGWLAQRGIHYLFVVAPTKQTIYPEYLPAGMRSEGSQAKIDQFFAFMRTNSLVEVVDLRPVLWKAKLEYPVFHRTDSHWNQCGSFLAYQELVRGLSRQIPGLEPLSSDEFEKTIQLSKGGNLAKMLMAEESLMEKDCPSLSPRPPLENLKVTNVFVKDINTIICENSKQIATALIFGDSFANGWFPFLGYHFKRVAFYRLYDTPQLHYWDPALIEKERPKVVIDEILEAFLAQEDAAEITLKDDLK